MTVKVKTINENIETFTTEQYIIGPNKDMHAAILDVKVYAGSHCIVHRRRHFQWIYKKFLYKPEKEELKELKEN